ncbi:MAG: NusG domain II-containing protein [Chitinivibrionales bacterium]
MIPKKFTPLDAFLILLLCASAALSVPMLLNAQPSSVRVYRDSKLIAEYSISQEKTVHLRGHIGQVTIRIEDESVHVTEAGCDKQLCVRSGKIDAPYEQIVCAPNHLLIEIAHSRKGDTLDAVAR